MNVPAQGSKRRFSRIICLVFLLIAAIAGLFFAKSHYGDALFAYVLYSCLALLVLEQSVSLYYGESRETCCGRTGGKLLIAHIISSIALAFLIELGTLLGSRTFSPLVLSDWSLRRIAVYAAIIYSLLLEILIFVPHAQPIQTLLRAQLCRTAKQMGIFVERNRIRICALLFVTFLLSLLISELFNLSIVAVFSFIAAIIISASYVIIHWNEHGNYPERLFLFVALPVGFAFIAALPCNNLITWDNDVHYQNALNLSYIANVETTASDRMLINNLAIEPGFSSTAALGRDGSIDPTLTWSQQDLDRLNAEFDEQAVSATTTVQPGFCSTFLSIKAFSYAPAAIGLWMGRLFHLPFFMIYAFGRVMNLIFYCVICYFAIKITPVKRVLFCVLSLLPTVLVMAATYSYDPFILALSYLGLALFLREFVDSQSICWRNVFVSMALLFLAFSPKAVYFPIMGIVLMFLWNGRTKPTKARKKVVTFTVFLAVALVVSFIIPLIIHEPGMVGDLRGGADVNSSEQLGFILSDPLRYASILIRFLFEIYLPVSSLEEAFTNLAYLGSVNVVVPAATGLVTIALSTIAILDSDNKSARLISWKNSLWTLFFTACTLLLICSSLYVSFTAVGSDTIAGVQPRYLLPLLPTFFLFVFNFRMNNCIKRRCFSGVTVSVSALLLYACLWVFLISRIII